MPTTPQKLKNRPLLRLALLLLAASFPLAAQQPNPSPQLWGDQSDGTYANPILPADFSDLDAIRVGDQYFAISSTFQYSPGMAILQSSDLVNWHIAGHVVQDISTLSPELNWDRMNRPGRGIWAGAIRFHAGRFWVYFGTPDEGIFMASAPAIAGPWTTPTLVLPEAGWDDPCPFWDDDGKLYLVTTHFKPDPANGKPYNIHLFQLSTDGRHILPGTDRILHQSRGSEANKLYKIHGLYFHYFSHVTPEGRVPMIERSSSLDGPWQIRQLMHVNGAIDKEPNQGGLIQLPSGDWYFLTHQGKGGGWEGRAAVLLPITWLHDLPKDSPSLPLDGTPANPQLTWPIIGEPGPDLIGHMLWRHPKPIPGFPLTSTSASDDFSSTALRPEWEWNYQPRPHSWSLTERPGYLRLHAFPALHPTNLLSTSDILTQRSMRTPLSTVTVKLDLSGMADGQQSGLIHYTRHYATLGVLQQGNNRSLIFEANGVPQTGPTLTSPTLWLRSSWALDGVSHFSYSLDGTNFTPFGDPYPLEWADYRGDRIGLYTTNPQTSGYLDIDDFRYDITR